jgi:hypothetical protein
MKRRENGNIAEVEIRRKKTERKTYKKMD